MILRPYLNPLFQLLGSNSPKQTNQGFENPIQGGSNDVDDFFGTESQAQPYPEVRQASPLQNQNFQSNNANQGKIQI